MFGLRGAGRKIRWPKDAGCLTFSRSPSHTTRSSGFREYSMRRTPARELPLRRSHSFRVVGLAAALLTGVSLPLRSQVSVTSPDGRNHVTVQTHDGQLTYSLTRDTRPLILPSILGFEF